MAQSQYAQVSDIKSLSMTPQAAQRFGDASINAALQAASSRADSYLASQFTLPLLTDPQGWDMALTRCVCDLAAFDLYRQYGLNPNAPDYGALKALYDDAIAWLVMVRDKKIFPQYVDSGEDLGTPEAGPFVISDAPVGFTSRGVTDSDSDDGLPRGLP